MLPTQFIPEYYRDSKDIINAADPTEPRAEKSPPRRSFFAFILRLFRRSEKKSEEIVVSPWERLARSWVELKRALASLEEAAWADAYWW